MRIKLVALFLFTVATPLSVQPGAQADCTSTAFDIATKGRTEIVPAPSSGQLYVCGGAFEVGGTMFVNFDWLFKTVHATADRDVPFPDGMVGVGQGIRLTTSSAVRVTGTVSTRIVGRSVAAPRVPGVQTPTPPGPDPTPGSKAVLTASDFSYLGALRMPQEGVDTAFAYGNMTGRMVNGQVHLFLYGNHTKGDPVFEIVDPGGGYSPDYARAARASLAVSWGDVYAGRRLTLDGTTALHPGGLYWNDSTKLLYWTYYDAYNVSLRKDPGLGASSLDDATSARTTAHGPWRMKATDADGTSWYGSWRCLYLFAHPVDGSLMCGSTIQSGNSGAPWGPDAYGGVAWPTASTPTTADLPLPSRFLEYYFMGNAQSANFVTDQGALHGALRAFRRRGNLPVWEGSQGTLGLRANPATNGGVGSWSELDSTGGAIWLELEHKRGVLFASTLAGALSQDASNCTLNEVAHEWYSNAGLQSEGRCAHGCLPPVLVTGPVTTAAFPALIIYDPDDLNAVKSGARKDYSLEPTATIDLEQAYRLKTADVRITGAGKTVRGFYFDPIRKYLYVLAPSADDSRVGPSYLESLIHVFAVRD